MDFYCVLEKAGTRVGRKKRKRGRVGLKQRVTKEEAQQWFKDRFSGVLV